MQIMTLDSEGDYLLIGDKEKSAIAYLVESQIINDKMKINLNLLKTEYV